VCFSNDVPMVYPILTVIVALLFLADIGGTIYTPILMKGDLAAKQSASTMVAMLLLAATIIASVAAGYFLLDVFYMIKGAICSEGVYPNLDNLPHQDTEYYARENGSRISEDKMDRTLKTIKLSIPDSRRSSILESESQVQPLISELKKAPLSADRVDLCEQFVKKLPRRTRLTQGEMNSVLRHFGDVDDGLKILNIFDPHLKGDKDKVKKVDHKKKKERHKTPRRGRKSAP